jgi:hypothetical protein
MSDLSTLIENVHKPWLNPRVNNLTVDGVTNITTIGAANLNITGTTTTQNLVVTGNTTTGPITSSSVNNSGLATTQTLTVGTSAVIPSLSFGISSLNYYEIFTINGSFSGVWAAPIPTVITIVKLGRMVSLNVAGNSYSILATTAAPAAFSTPIPVRFRPLAVGNQVFEYITVVDDGVNTAGTWFIDVNTGVLIVGKGLSAAGNFSGTSTTGGTGWDSFNVSWVSAT